jgi:hypothetical protein
MTSHSHVVGIIRDTNLPAQLVFGEQSISQGSSPPLDWLSLSIARPAGGAEWLANAEGETPWME